MAEPITYYTEFASPYAYFGNHLIGTVAAAHGREVIWRPISLGRLWKAIGRGSSSPQKMSYLGVDCPRTARLLGLPFTMPNPFPVDARLARNAFYRLNRSDKDLASRFVIAVANQYWGEGKDISTPEQLADIAAQLGIPADEIAAAVDDAEARAEEAEAREAAVALGMFGTPFITCDGQVYWGHDRIAHLDLVLSGK